MVEIAGSSHITQVESDLPLHWMWGAKMTLGILFFGLSNWKDGVVNSCAGEGLLNSRFKEGEHP